MLIQRKHLSPHSPLVTCSPFSRSSPAETSLAIYEVCQCGCTSLNRVQLKWQATSQDDGSRSLPCVTRTLLVRSLASLRMTTLCVWIRYFHAARCWSRPRFCLC